MAVVGGGISGLAAAWQLEQWGIDALVIEASRPGGRICTERGPVGRVETGMQFYYSSYRETRRLLAAMGLLGDLARVHVRGHILWRGHSRPFSKTRPWLGHLSWRENVRLQAGVARHLAALAALDPFERRPAEPLDAIDVRDAFAGEDLFEVAIRPLVTSYAFVEPEGHSLALLLRIIRLGAQASTWALRGGNDRLVRRLAEGLRIERGRVRRILLEGGRPRGLVVDWEERRDAFLEAGAVICALPPQAAAPLLGDDPNLARTLAALPCSTILLVNLVLDRLLPGPDWVYVMSRRAGQVGAFALDLAHRLPGSIDGETSLLQVNIVSPTSDRWLAADDEALIARAVSDMEAFLPQIGGWVREATVVRRPQALPNFPAGSLEGIVEVERLAARWPGLFMAGDFLRSPLCESAVRSGLKAAHRAAARLLRRDT